MTDDGAVAKDLLQDLNEILDVGWINEERREQIKSSTLSLVHRHQLARRIIHEKRIKYWFGFSQTVLFSVAVVGIILTMLGFSDLGSNGITPGTSQGALLLLLGVIFAVVALCLGWFLTAGSLGPQYHLGWIDERLCASQPVKKRRTNRRKSEVVPGSTAATQSRSGSHTAAKR